MIVRICTLLLILMPASVHGECLSLIEFEIEDQFKRDHTHEEILGRTTILVWADREGSKHLEVWDEALTAAFGEDGVARRGIAHVKGVPGWVPGLKGKIRGHFSKEESEWTLMDWKGRFAKAYSPPQDQVSLFVFDAAGCMQGRVSGNTPEAVLIESLREAIDRANH